MMIVRRTARRGYGLVELAMAVFLFMVAMSLLVRVVGWVGRERRAAERRLMAVHEISNILERVSAEPYDRIDAKRVEELAGTSVAAAALPEPRWEAEVTAADVPAPRSKRVRLSLRWKSLAGNWEAPVRLVAWVFAGRRPS